MSVEEKINELVKEFSKRKKGRFIPGETPILTGLAVYDHKEINAIFNSVLEGWFGLSKKGKEFEERFSEKINRNYSNFVNSGSSANLLALNAIKNKLKLKKGEIITPACTFPTTLNPIIQLGFKPNFIDVDKTLNIAPESVYNAINKNTKGIMFAHTLGNPAQVDEILEIARQKNLFLIEDCCDALGSKYNNKTCGSFGEASTFSFYPAHILTTGEGGMVSTDDSSLDRIIKSLRDWGRDCYCTTDEKSFFGACRKRFDFKINNIPYDHKYIFSQIGYNLKPLELQAAMGLEQLLKLDEFIEIRKRNFEIYKRELSEFEEHFELPEINSKADPIFFGLPLTIKNPRIDRQSLLKFLNKNKIATRLFFGGNIIYHPAYKNIKYSISGELKNSNNILKNSFWMGIHPGISEEMIKYIGFGFTEYLKKI